MRDQDPAAIESQLQHATYRLILDGVDVPHTVAQVQVVETLSAPYRIELRIQTNDDDTLLFLEALGSPAALLIEHPSHDLPLRRWNGLLTEVRHHGGARATNVETTAGAGTYSAGLGLVIEPALVLGKLGQDSRIFQDKSSVQVIEEVLAEILGSHGRGYDASNLELSEYMPRNYCTQYKESNYDFVHRLMEDEGIGYYWISAPDSEQEVLCLFDSRQGLRGLDTAGAGVLRYVPSAGGESLSDVVRQFEFRLSSAATSVTVRDYDWARSHQERETKTETAGQTGSESYEHGFSDHSVIREEFAALVGLVSTAQAALIPLGWPSGAVSLLEDVTGTTIGNFTSDDVDRQSRIRLELLRRDIIRASGASHAMSLQPGTVFELVGHPTLSVDGEYLVTAVRHAGDSASPSDGGVNHFDCIPASVNWRPTRRTRQPRIYSVQTGVVWGPTGTDINTDNYGRIQVKFHWDRAGRDFFEAPSCWIRCSQVWAGAGHPGFSFIPRVGMEVIVSFVDGDPDRPLVIGCTHNHQHPHPVALPMQATKSVIRTRSVPFGSGYNELSFEDQNGHERVYLRAERDFDKLVQRDHTEVTNRDRRTVAKRDVSLKVGRNRVESVAGDWVVSTAKSERRMVGADSHLAVNGMRSELIHGSQDTVVHGRSRQLHVTNGSYLVEAATGLVQRQAGNTISMFSEISHPDGDGPEGIEIRSPDEIRIAAGEARVSVNGDNEQGIVALTRDAYVSIDNDKIELRLGGSVIQVMDGYVKINGKTFPAVGE